MKQFAVLFLVGVGFLYTSNAANAQTDFRIINGKAESIADWLQVDANVIGASNGGLLVQEFVNEKRSSTVTTHPRTPKLNRLQRAGAFSGTTTAGSRAVRTYESTYTARVPSSKALILHYWADPHPRQYARLLIKAKFIGTREIRISQGAREIVNVYDYGLPMPKQR